MNAVATKAAATMNEAIHKKLSATGAATTDVAATDAGPQMQRQQIRQ